MKSGWKMEAKMPEITDKRFWDCECEKNYIHEKAIELCNICGATRETQPDSHAKEVITYLLKRIHKDAKYIEELEDIIALFEPEEILEPEWDELDELNLLAEDVHLKDNINFEEE